MYFLYRFHRNQWRAKQLVGAKLDDATYRTAKELPVYTPKQFASWKKLLALPRIYAMPEHCESRIPPFDVWHIEEKVAWADKITNEGIFIEKATEDAAFYWNGRLPSMLQYRNVLAKVEKGVELDDDEMDIFENSGEQAVIREEVRLQEQLEYAHLKSKELENDDSFEDLVRIDTDAIDKLESAAVRGTKEAKEFAKASKPPSKRPSGDSPSKASSSRPALRKSKKSRGGMKSGRK